ncbi:hypothetical protein [Actinoplanes sp. DH11]|uniref:hypothetical protein n=1 Tax=Actinoplanes sp. DH11 TaxID=2857011 RepID=UPI001E35C236|nr:hypothetical protein [Actinoplanes sp. DH11]
MRKLWCAGALAGGILLFGAAPALADTNPVPDAGREPLSPLGQALEQTGNWRLHTPLASDPLSGEPLVDLGAGEGPLLAVRPGDNSIGRTDGLGGAAGAAGSARLENQKPARALPTADVVGGTLPDSGKQTRNGGKATGPIPVTGEILAREFANLPFDHLVQNGLPAVATLGPDGVPVAQDTGTPAAPNRRERARTGAPVVDGLGTAGLGGAVPVGGFRNNLDDLSTDISGLPLGGSPVQPQPARSVEVPPAAAASPGTPAAGTSTPAPASSVPGTSDSGSPAPGSPAPGAVPDAATPSGSAPDAAAPDAAAPGAAAPGGSAPGAAGAPAEAAHPTPDQSAAAPGAHSAAKSSGKHPSDKHRSDKHGGAHAPAAKPSASVSPDIAPRDKIDDPRLLEEPIEGLDR